MAQVQKDLINLNDAIEVDLPSDQGGCATVQYISGAGTVVLEGSNDGVAWAIIGLTPAAGGAVVANLAAVGLGFADVYACNKVRVRKSVGAASCVVNLSTARR